MNITKVLQTIRIKSKERGFNQSFDLIINLKNLDLKKQENRFTEDLQLPYPVSNKKIGVIGDILVKKARGVELKLTSSELQNLISDKKKAKEVFSKVDHIVAEASLMPKIAKEFGVILGPRNMMPKPLSPEADPNLRIESLKKTITIKLKDSPVIQCKVGHEKMKDQEVLENVESVLSFVENRLPKGRDNIRNIKLKLTMGPPVEIK